MDEIWKHPDVDFFAEFPDGRGCQAKIDIPAGALLLHAPISACIFPESGDELDLVRLVVEILETPGSRYHEYLSALRTRDFSDHPVMWAAADLAHRFQGMSLLGVYRSSIGRWFAEGVLPETNVFRFATAVMLSRGFSHETAGIAIVPFADQFNHSSRGWQTRIREDSAGFCMYAEESISAGEQIFNFYGEVSDFWLLLTHGFTEAPGANPFNYSILISIEDSVCELDEATDRGWVENQLEASKRHLSHPWFCDLRNFEFSLLRKLVDRI